MASSKRISALFALVPFLLQPSFFRPVYAQTVTSDTSVSRELDALSTDVVHAFHDVDTYHADFKRSADAAFVQAGISYARNLGNLVAEFEKYSGRDFPPRIEEDPVFSEFIHPLLSHLYQDLSTRNTAVQVYDQYKLIWEQRRTETLSRRLSTLQDKLHAVRSDLLPAYIAGSLSGSRAYEFQDAIHDLDKLERKVLDLGAYQLPIFEGLSVSFSSASDNQQSPTTYQYEVQHGLKEIKAHGLRWTAQFDYLSKKFDEYNQKLSEEHDPTVKQDLVNAILSITQYFSLLNREIIPSQITAQALPQLPPIDNKSDADTSFTPLYLPNFLQPGPTVNDVQQPHLSLDAPLSTPLFQKFQTSFWVIALDQFQLEWAFFSQMRYEAMKTMIKEKKEVPHFDYVSAIEKAFTVAQQEAGKNLLPLERYLRYYMVRDGDQHILLSYVADPSFSYELKEPVILTTLTASKKKHILKSVYLGDGDLTYWLGELPPLVLDHKGRVQQTYPQWSFFGFSSSDLLPAYNNLIDENKLVHDAAPSHFLRKLSGSRRFYGKRYPKNAGYPFVAVSLDHSDLSRGPSFNERYPFSLKDTDAFLYAVARLSVASKMREEQKN